MAVPSHMTTPLFHYIIAKHNVLISALSASYLIQRIGFLRESFEKQLQEFLNGSSLIEDMLHKIEEVITARLDELTPKAKEEFYAK